MGGARSRSGCPAARPGPTFPCTGGERALVLPAASVRLRCGCRAPTGEKTASWRGGGRGDSGSPSFTRKWLSRNMALLVRVLVSEGVILCGRSPDSRAGVGQGGTGTTGRECGGGACAVAGLLGRFLRGN